MAHWATEIAERLIKERPNKKEYVCAAGISPSGSVHIGNFRDIATSLFVVKALQQKGKNAKLLFSWDDFDRLRKVPSNVQAFTTNFEENIGKPYTFFPSPFNKELSYGEYFEKEFEETLRIMNVKADIKRQTEKYTAGAYKDKIKLALSKRKEIYDIIMSFKTQDANEEERENYYPVSVYCENCKKDNTKVLSYDEKTGTLKFFCEDCQKTHEINVDNYNLIKLVWKVDWPMRWQYESVDFEPGGIDHASANGSYDVAKNISRQIFGYEPPIFQGYGWLGIRGLGSMHSSTGNNITPAKVLEVYEPEIVKWLFAKYRPEDAFDFAFDETVTRHYSEYDKLLKNYTQKLTTDVENELVDLIIEDKSQFEEKTSFGVLVGVAPVVDFNPLATKKALKKAGVDFEENSIQRLSKVKNWIETYNPDKKYNLLETFNDEYYSLMTDESKDIIKKLFDYISKNEFTEKDVQLYLYSIMNDETASKKENVERQKNNFKNLYNMLFGRDDGPRLYLYLAASDKNNYLKLLNK